MMLTKKFKQDLIMSDENKEILDQVTELISSKKEQIKEGEFLRII